MPTVLVTGANRGIGLEFARQYAGDGWKVLATARDLGKAGELRKVTGEVSVMAMDVADDGSIRKLADDLAGQPIDLLINNAGISGRKEGQPRGSDNDMAGVDPEFWLKVLRINSIGPLLVTRAFRKNLAQGERKLVASITSMLGSIASNQSGGMYIYRSSKTALNMVNKSMAVELASDGIAAIVFHPGWVKTDMGGASAPVSPQQSAGGMRKVLETVRLEDSGSFFNYDGSPIAW